MMDLVNDKLCHTVREYVKLCNKFVGHSVKLDNKTNSIFQVWAPIKQQRMWEKLILLTRWTTTSTGHALLNTNG